MKKILMVTFISTLVITSCKKEYACYCTTVQNNFTYDTLGNPTLSSVTTGTAYVTTKEKVHKRKAPEACHKLNGTWNSGSGFLGLAGAGEYKYSNCQVANL